MGNGDLMTSEIRFASFEKINSTSSANIRYHASDEYRVVVTIDANIYEYVDIYTRNNVLHIRSERGHNFSPTKFMVDVYCPVLSGVTMSGSGVFTTIDPVIASRFEAVISGSGKVDGTFECDHFSVRNSGSGKIIVDGYSRNGNIVISGSGNYHGNELMLKNATVNISGSGNVNIFVTDYLKAVISGSGRIDYWGNPKIDSTISGSGRIRQK